jgi:hypothetical protein
VKVTQTALSPSPPVFVPQQVVITLETQGEARAFYHLVGCWNEQSTCLCRPETVELAEKLVYSLKPPVMP